MRYLLFLVSVNLLGQISGFNGKPITTDDKIALYEGWVAGDPANTANQTLLAAAYIQKTRETTDFSYLDRASKIVDKVLSAKRDYEAMRLRNLIELNRHHFAKVIEYTREMTRSAPSEPTKVVAPDFRFEKLDSKLPWYIKAWDIVGTGYGVRCTGDGGSETGECVGELPRRKALTAITNHQSLITNHDLRFRP